MIPVGRFIVRLVIGAVFLFAASGKIAAPAHFAEQIQAYRMMPEALTNGLAYILPWVELFVAVFYVLGLWKREVAGLLIAMLGVFAVAKSWVYYHNYNIDCGCFGWPWLTWLEKLLEGFPGILFNLAMILLIALELALTRRNRKDAAPGEEAATTGAGG